MNIILKSFGGPLHTALITEAFKGLHIETCININNARECTPEINADQITWMNAKHLHSGEYPNVDWNTITPLDEELIENMYHCEMRFLSMIERYAIAGDIPYRERKRQYLAHLRYWSHVIETENIKLFLLFHAPHQCYDYVIFELCKLKGIAVHHLDHFYVLDSITLIEDFEESGKMLLPAFKKLQEEYADPQKEIPLCPHYENFFKNQTTKDIAAQWTPLRNKKMNKNNFASKWINASFALLIHRPKKFLNAICSTETWSRKIAQHKAATFYDTYAKEPDFSKPYIYVPLHMQPEEAVSPRGGAFENQELIVQLLAAHIPEGVGLYVKEHPNQGELCRNKEFYKSMQEIPSVTLVDRNTDTFRLMRESKAVATITGTAGFEALFRKKPILMFGHRFYQYAPGVYPIQTEEDCSNAIESIFKKEEKPTLRDMRIFLKAMEDESTPYFFPRSGATTSEVEGTQYILKTGKMMHKILAPLFR